MKTCYGCGESFYPQESPVYSYCADCWEDYKNDEEGREREED